MALVVRNNVDVSVPVLCWDNPAKHADITSDATFEAGFPVTALATYPTWEGPRVVGDSPWSVLFDFGSAKPVDYLAVSSIETFGSFDLFIQSSDDGDSFTTEQVGINFDEGTNLALFGEINRRYIRLTWQNVRYIGNLMMGKATRLERSIYVGHSPINLNRQTQVTGAHSESGQYLGRIVRSETLGTNIELTNLSPTFLRSTLDPFFRAARSQPFYWAWKPGAYQEVAYAWMDGNPSVSNSVANGLMTASFQIRGRSR